MTLEQLIKPFPWKRYSKKLASRIATPRSAGIFVEAEAKERGMRFATGEDGAVADGNYVIFYWLVDPEDGCIVDAKYQAFGQSALIGGAEAACDIIVGKNYDQAHRLSVDLIDKHLRDRSDTPAFPPETQPHLNLLLGAMDDAAVKCIDIPLAEQYVAPPMTADLGEALEGGYPGWMEMSEEKKIALIEHVLTSDVRPYIALDAGGVEVKKLVDGKELHITYQGNCTSCISSIGATLSYIQQVLRNKVHPDIHVIPDIPSV